MDSWITTRRGNATLLALGLLLAAPVAGQGHFPAEAELEVMLHYLVEDGAAPGIVLGLLEASGAPSVLSHGSGGPGARPLGGGSVFEVGSITKTFTGTLLAEMAARGEVDLSDPVSRYLPPPVRVPSRGGREITLLDLATHRSGLPSLPDDFIPGDLADPYADYTIERLYAFLSRHELSRAPGAAVEYSNLGFGLLGHALARAAGTSYRELLRERILEPLGMDRTGHAVDEEMSTWLTTGFKHGRPVPPWTTTEAFAGAGGLYSTAEDLLKYVAANVGPPVTALERAMRDAQEPRGPFDGPPLGLAEVDVPAAILERYVGTYEFSPGVHFFVRLEDDGTLTAQGGRNTVRFRQYADSDSTFFLRRLPRRAAFRTGPTGSVDAMIMDPDGRPRVMPKVSDATPPPGIPRREVLDLPLTARDLARYEGGFRLDMEGRRLEVQVYSQDGQLMGRLVGGAVTRLLSQGNHVFLMDADTDNRLVFDVWGTQARGLTLHLGRTVIRGVRRP